MRKADVLGNPTLLKIWEAKQARRKARRESKKAEPVPRGQESASVKKIFETVLESLRKGVEADLQAHYARLAKQAMEWDGLPEREVDQITNKLYHRTNRDWKYDNPDFKFQSYLMHYESRRDVPGQVVRIVKVKEHTDRFVADALRDMFESFIAKQTEKVNGIIKGRKVHVRSSVSRSLEGIFDFTLEDGAKFRMKTQIIWKMSPKGKRFWQFPTTFHDAYKANGAPIRVPSEDALKKEL